MSARALLRRAVAAVRWRGQRLLRRRRVWSPGGPLTGCRLRLPPGMEAVYVDQEYEPAVADALVRLVRCGFSCVDLGAHVGYFSILLAKLSGETGRVYSFEPSPANAHYIRENVRLNALEGRVVLEVAAVADRSGQVELYAGRAGGSSEWTVDQAFASRKDVAPTVRRPMVVRAVALDDYFPVGATIDLVKMDIEGAEGRALQGMRRILAQAAPIIVLEFHREVGWPAIEQLLAIGYLLERLDGTPFEAASAADVPYQLVARQASGPRAAYGRTACA